MKFKMRMAMIVLSVAALLIVASVFSAFAQDNGETPVPPFGMMGGFRHGMMFGGWNGDSMWSSVAESLGIDLQTLSAELQAGKTLAEITQEQGVDVQTIYDNVLATATAHMSAMVAAGVITQEEADTHLAWMRENIDQMPMLSGAGVDNCPMGGMGMMGTYGHGYGMMGRGMRGGMNWGPRGGGPRQG